MATAVLRQIRKLRFQWILYLLMIPTVGLVATFNYFPEVDAVKFSFFRWDGAFVEEFRGLENYLTAFSDSLFWQSFGLVALLLAFNLAKMWPSIFTAVIIHRLQSERWQYMYRVLFVIPMIIPSLVGLLIWKSFYDPTVGILNKILQGTGMIDVLQWLDVTMPKVSAVFTPVFSKVIDPWFGSVYGLGVVGVLCLGLAGGFRQALKGWMWSVPLVITAWILLGFGRAVIFVAGILFLAEILRKDRKGEGEGVLRWMGSIVLVAMVVLLLLGKMWISSTNAFATGSPAWLSNTKLIVPSLVFWGFPWVGVFGVLIYLAGLQNISQDIYEAGKLDGISWWGKFSQLEFPLIMTQVRLNLILITIGTINDYGLILILLGPHGGAGNVGMVPGLYMFREGFYNQQYGYACALGMIMFIIIMAITLFYQRMVRVDK